MDGIIEPFDTIFTRICTRIAELPLFDLTDDEEREKKKYTEYLHDFLLQLFLMYWRNNEYGGVLLTGDRGEVEISVTNENVTYPRPTHVLSRDIPFDRRFETNALYQDLEDQSLYGKADRFVQDFMSFIRIYDDILPLSVKENIYLKKEKYSLLNYLLGRRPVY